MTNQKTTENKMETSKNYYFEWNVGGYNNVSATNETEALAKAEKLGQGWKSGGVKKESLTLDADHVLTEKANQFYSGMFN